MQISNLFLLIIPFHFLSITIQALEPSPAPFYGDDDASLVGGFSPPSPIFSESPAPATVDNSGGLVGYPAPVPSQQTEMIRNENADSYPAAGEDESETVRWCAVRKEYEDCQSLASVLKETYGYTWTCINKGTTQQCLESIKNGESDIINIEAGMAYTAFTNYSMKAIANEVYCDQAKRYDAVVLVNRKACEEKEDISLYDFKGYISCHGGHSTAAGWNYPINHIGKFFGLKEMNDQEIALNFFSKVCAPSEFEQGGVCNGCTDENGVCALDLYSGHSGAFRCLVQELGDIAFVRGDTALLYSLEGPYNQSWSTKSVRDFMYLCPKGGCREINGYPGSCSFGRVPANVIMASNSIPNTKKSLILQTLTNATWRGDLIHSGKSSSGNLLSPSMQQLSMIKELTRSYLGNSASISESIQKLNTPIPQASPSTIVTDSEVSSSWYKHPGVTMNLSIVTLLMLVLLTHP